VRLGRTARKPDIGVGSGYERDEGDHVVFGRLLVRLPMFDRGQGTEAAGRARAARVRAELAATREAILQDVRARGRAFEERRTALVRFTDVALPALADNDTLAQRSYEAGQINLIELLLIRRESLNLRHAYVTHLAAALQARIEVEASAGVIR
jgi:cobalt-zinc-cadmium efflux system outer membrane protein